MKTVILEVTPEEKAEIDAWETRLKSGKKTHALAFRRFMASKFGCKPGNRYELKVKRGALQ